MRSKGYRSCPCLCACVSVKSHLTSGASLRLFVLKILSHTQRATEVKIFVGFSLYIRTASE